MCVTQFIKKALRTINAPYLNWNRGRNNRIPILGTQSATKTSCTFGVIRKSLAMKSKRIIQNLSRSTRVCYPQTGCSILDIKSSSLTGRNETQAMIQYRNIYIGKYILAYESENDMELSLFEKHSRYKSTGQLRKR